MYCFYDNPNPPVKDTIRAAVFKQYLQQCVEQLDWQAIESAETELAIQTLQEILSAMQNGKADDREILRQIDEIFVRKLGQYTEKGMKIRADMRRTE